MSKITKKDIKELREAIEKEIGSLEGEIGVMRGQIASLLKTRERLQELEQK